MVDDPLSLEEFCVLEQFLLFPYPEASPLSFTQTHGFLCALMTAPHLIMPSTWQEIVLGGHPLFESLEQAENILDLLFRLSNQIGSELMAKTFKPVIFENGKQVVYDTAAVEQIGTWCEGYLHCAMLDPLWSTNSEVGELFLPLALPATFSFLKEQSGIDRKLLVKNYLSENKEFRRHILKIIACLYEYWAGQRQAGKILHHLTQVPSLQSLESAREQEYYCLCGSGQQYKDCCSYIYSSLIH